MLPSHKVITNDWNPILRDKSNVFHELIVSVEKIVNAGGNHYRKKAIIK